MPKDRFDVAEGDVGDRPTEPTMLHAQGLDLLLQGCNGSIDGETLSEMISDCQEQMIWNQNSKPGAIYSISISGYQSLQVTSTSSVLYRCVTVLSPIAVLVPDLNPNNPHAQS